MALAPAAAGDEPPAGLQMEARVAFDGYFKYGEWLPLWIELENSGPDLEAEVQVRLAGAGGATTFAAPAPLPGGSRKRIPLYVLPNNYSHELEVELVAGDRVLQVRNETGYHISDVVLIQGGSSNAWATWRPARRPWSRWTWPIRGLDAARALGGGPGGRGIAGG